MTVNGVLPESKPLKKAAKYKSSASNSSLSSPKIMSHPSLLCSSPFCQLALKSSNGSPLKAHNNSFSLSRYALWDGNTISIGCYPYLNPSWIKIETAPASASVSVSVKATGSETAN